MAGAASDVLVVVGTRPEAIKLAPVVHALTDRDAHVVLCLTGQHHRLVAQALQTFRIEPQIVLAGPRAGHDLSLLTAQVLQDVAAVIREVGPRFVVVQGDTTTALAAGIAAFYAHVPLAHVEAGLRTHELLAPMPEEANRRLLAVISDVHYAPSELARRNLLREGVDDAAIQVTGNTGVDALHWVLRSFPAPDVARSSRYVVVTVHRRETTDTELQQIVAAVGQLARRHADVEFVWPVHPNPRRRTIIMRAAATGAVLENLRIVDALPYEQFAHLLAGAEIALTDSGGIQEEAPVLGVPVLVLNRATARREPVDRGTAEIVGTDGAAIVDAVDRLLVDGSERARRRVRYGPYGDGGAASRIADDLARASRVRQAAP